jgi:hypothetical protein
LRVGLLWGRYLMEASLDLSLYSVEVLPSGELLILDSANSNLYRISASLSLCKWVAWKYCLVHLVSLDSFLFLLESVVFGVFFC